MNASDPIVRLFDIEDGQWTERWSGSLSSFVHANETEDADEILDALRSSGRYQAGGGATPEFRIEGEAS